MLRADLIDLSILALLVDWHDTSGRFFSLSELQSHLGQHVTVVSDAEIIDALILLFERDLIAVERYSDSQFVPYANEGSAYFYKANLRFRARPLARRRLQELTAGKRSGIFLSHISEESAMAFRLRRLFKEALSAEMPVFVSSDYVSIPSGEPWYQKILQGLSQVQGIVSLLSPASLQRPWINFEAGIGVGCDARVMPLVWRGLQKGDVAMPLGYVQVRALHDEEDLKGLLRDIAALCHTPFKEGPVSAFLLELAALEAAAPVHGLSATLFRQGRQVRMLIQNNSSRPVELLEAELLAPDTLAGANCINEYQPVLVRRNLIRDDVRYIGTCLTIHPSTVLHLGVSALKPILGPGDIYVPDHLGITLPETLSADEEMLSICYSVSGRQQVFGPKTTALKDIPLTAAA
jgi:TIR domain